jgi:hypothetical protein
MLENFTWMAPEKAITEFLYKYIAHWPRVQHWPGYQYYGSYRNHDAMAYKTTPQDLAEDLIDNFEFRSLQLGTWLNKPDAQLITAAVEAITPPPYNEDIELLVEGLKLAAQAQRQDGWKRTLLTTGATVGMSMLLAASKD